MSVRDQQLFIVENCSTVLFCFGFLCTKAPYFRWLKLFFEPRFLFALVREMIIRRNFFGTLLALLLYMQRLQGKEKVFLFSQFFLSMYAFFKFRRLSRMVHITLIILSDGPYKFFSLSYWPFEYPACFVRQITANRSKSASSAHLVILKRAIFFPSVISFFISLSIRRFCGKGERWKRKRES